MGRTLARLLPREGKFFDYFSEHVGHAVVGAAELRALLGSEKLRDAIGKLESMDNTDAILRVCSEIDPLETDADYIRRLLA